MGRKIVDGPIKREGACLKPTSEYRKIALTAAHELCYGEDVKLQIANAKTDYEISQILSKARISH